MKRICKGACLLALSSLSLIGCNSTETLENEKVTQNVNNEKNNTKVEKKDINEKVKEDKQLIHTDFDQETTIEGASRFPLSTDNYFNFVDTITNVVKWLPGYNGEGNYCETLSEEAVANGFFAIYTFDSSIENVPLQLEVSYSEEIDGEIHLESVGISIGNDSETPNTLENNILAKNDLVKYATLISNSLLPEGFMDIDFDFNKVINFDTDVSTINNIVIDGINSELMAISVDGEYLATGVKFLASDNDYKAEDLVVYNKEEMNKLRKTIEELSELGYAVQSAEFRDEYSNIWFNSQEKGSRILLYSRHIDGKIITKNVELVQTWGETTFAENCDSFMNELNDIQKVFFDMELTKSDDVKTLNEKFVTNGSQSANYFTEYKDKTKYICTEFYLENEHGNKEFSANMEIGSDELVENVAQPTPEASPEGE